MVCSIYRSKRPKSKFQNNICKISENKSVVSYDGEVSYEKVRVKSLNNAFRCSGSGSEWVK